MDNLKLKSTVCIITYSPLGKSGIAPLSNLIAVLRGVGSKVSLITGGDILGGLTLDGDIRLLKVNNEVGSNVLTRLLNHFWMQVRILSYAMKMASEHEIFIIFLSGESLVGTMLALKVFGKRTIMMFGVTPSKAQFVHLDVFSRIWLMLTVVNMRIADRLILYSDRIVRDANISRYRHKILILHEHSIDFEEFHVKKKLNERGDVIGYVGRLLEVKGILNFAKAIPIIIERTKGIGIVICGDGDLYSKVESLIVECGLESRVRLTGWVSRSDLSNVLNEMKLLVLPSYSEALPNILLEAMACGTPVLATPVGAVPDIVEDGETGFLLESNDPRHIADRVVELLDRKELLEQVSDNAHRWVRENFSRERTIELWREALTEFV